MNENIKEKIKEKIKELDTNKFIDWIEVEINEKSAYIVSNIFQITNSTDYMHILLTAKILYDDMKQINDFGKYRSVIDFLENNIDKIKAIIKECIQ